MIVLLLGPHIYSRQFIFVVIGSLVTHHIIGLLFYYYCCYYVRSVGVCKNTSCTLLNNSACIVDNSRPRLRLVSAGEQIVSGSKQ